MYYYVSIQLKTKNLDRGLYQTSDIVLYIYVTSYYFVINIIIKIYLYFRN